MRRQPHVQRRQCYRGGEEASWGKEGGLSRPHDRISHHGGREETKEGMDKKMAVAYYAKWKFVKDLLGSLKDEGSKVVSVMAPGYGGSIDVDDLDMKKSYSAVKVGLRMPTYLDLMSEVCITIPRNQRSSH